MVPHIQTGYHVSRPTKFSLDDEMSTTGYHSLLRHFPEPSSVSLKACINPPLLATFGISVDFFFLGVLRCFSSPVCPCCYVSQQDITYVSGFPSIFGNPRLKWLLLSNLAIVPIRPSSPPDCQGIHRVALSHLTIQPEEVLCMVNN